MEVLYPALTIQAEQLRKGVLDVRQTLGLNFPVSDADIEDSLYYYYYDVSKTIDYLLSESLATNFCAHH